MTRRSIHAALAVAGALALSLAAPICASAATVRLDQLSTQVATLSAGSVMSNGPSLLQVDDGSAAISWRTSGPSTAVDGEVTTSGYADFVVARGTGASLWSKPLRLAVPADCVPIDVHSGQNVVSLPGGRFAFVTAYAPKVAGNGSGVATVRVWNGTAWSAPLISLSNVAAVGGIAVDDAGRIVLVAEQWSTNEAGIGTAQVTVTTWKSGTVTTQEPSQLSGTHSARLAADGDHLLIAWTDYTSDPVANTGSVFIRTATIDDGVVGDPTTVATFAAPNTVGADPEISGYSITDLRVRGTKAYLAWTELATSGASHVRYRYGSDLAAAPSLAFDERLTSYDLGQITSRSNRLVLGPNGPQYLWGDEWRVGQEYVGLTLQGLTGSPDASLRLEPKAATPTAFAANLFSLDDGSVRMLWNARASSDPSTIVRLSPTGTVQARHVLVQGKEPKVPGVLPQGFMPTVGSAGSYVRVAYVYGAAIRTGILRDAGSSTDRLAGGAEGDTMAGGGGNDTIVGNAGNDHIFGDAGNDAVWGGVGADLLTGGAGTDHLLGGIGNDTLDLRDPTSSKRARDVVSCGPGIDRVLADRTDRIAGDCEIVNNKRV